MHWSLYTSALYAQSQMLWHIIRGLPLFILWVMSSPSKMMCPNLSVQLNHSEQESLISIAATKACGILPLCFKVVLQLKVLASAQWDSCHAALSCSRKELDHEADTKCCNPLPTQKKRRFVSMETREIWSSEVISQGCLTWTPKKQAPVKLLLAILELQHGFSCVIAVGWDWTSLNISVS